MNYDLTQFPISPATDETTAIQQLGYFWRRIFADKAAVTGLVQGATSGAAQNYVDLLDAISAYSASNIPVFSQTNWYPLTISTLDLNQTLTYGENVTYGELVNSTPYTYGGLVPEQSNVYTVLAPAGLNDITIAADHIITPSTIWVAGQNMKLLGNRIYFYGNPIPAGHGNITLWFYNAQVDAQALYDNFGFLFGLNLGSTEQTKAILSAMVNVLANGPSVANIKKVCVACLNMINSTTDEINAVITVEDQCDKKLWWQTDMFVSPNGSPQNLPLSLPPQMFLLGLNQALRFLNSSEPVALVNNKIQFPVIGTPSDVALFNAQINSSSTFLANLSSFIGGSGLSTGHPNAMINPVDFIFKSMLGSTTTLVHVTFNSLAQMALFEKVFGVLRNSLPPYVWLLFICEVNAASESYVLSSETITESYDATYTTLNGGTIQETVHMNTSGSGLRVNDMVLRRTLPSGATSEDINNLGFTQLP